MKVLFIYPDRSPDHARRFSLGLAQLSASLKKAGHQVFLYQYSFPWQSLDELVSWVRDLAPGVLAYSAMTNQMANIRTLAQRLAPLNIYSVLGGVHPTLLPEESLSVPGIKAICRGEAEEAFVEFLDTLERGGDVSSIRNFWVKDGDAIRRNDCRPLIEDLDALPEPDYGLFQYDSLPEYSVNRSLAVAASRGCVHNCTYCCNHALRALYPNRNKYLRYKSPAATVRSIRAGLALYPGFQRVRFVDDTLSQKIHWFREFVALYKTEVGIPFSTNDRCTQISEEVADLYAASGCTSVDLGIESGNPEMRNNVMHRKMSDEQILTAFSLLKSRGINTNAFNVLGMPGETMASLADTLKLNARVRPFMTYNAFFQPFPATQAREQCIAQGLKMETVFPPGFAIKPMVSLNTVSADELLFVMKFFGPLVRLYRLALPGNGNGAPRPWLQRALDALLMRGRILFRLVNPLVPTTAEFRLKHPRIDQCVTAAVRAYRLARGSRKRY